MKSNRRQTSKLMAPGKNSMDGVRCVPLSWSNFSLEMTIGAGGTDRLRILAVENTISYTVSAPYTTLDLINSISRRSATPVPIESLAHVLSKNVGKRGRVLFGFVGDLLDEIAIHQNMTWWISSRGLNMQLHPQVEVLPPFEELVGKLMLEARSRITDGKRLALAEFVRIADALDKGKFRLLDFLEGKDRKALALWNQKNPRKAIHSFGEALQRRRPELHRAIKRRFYRAVEKYRKAQANLSGF